MDGRIIEADEGSIRVIGTVSHCYIINHGQIYIKRPELNLLPGATCQSYNLIGE